MYIQNYFKSGKPKKSRNEIKSLDDMVKLFISLNNSKFFKNVNTNYKKRDVIFDDGTKKNLWSIMQEYGCEEI